MVALVLTAAALAASAHSGLYGTVTRGPTKPVCEVGTPCTAPAVGARLVFSRGGVAAATVVTGKGGRYRIGLRPGSYTVRAGAKLTIGRGLEPHAVVVPRGRFLRANFTIDTGIR